MRFSCEAAFLRIRRKAPGTSNVSFLDKKETIARNNGRCYATFLAAAAVRQYSACAVLYPCQARPCANSNSRIFSPSWTAKSCPALRAQTHQRRKRDELNLLITLHCVKKCTLSKG